MKEDALAQCRDVGNRIDAHECFRQIGDDAQVLVDLDEGAVEQLVRLLRRLIGTDTRIEIDGGVCNRDDDRVPIRTRRRACRRADESNASDENDGGRGYRTEYAADHSEAVHQPPASRFKSARSVNACIGVRLSTSSALSR